MAKKAKTPKQQPVGHKATAPAAKGTGGDGETVAGYFRRLFHENPRLLESRSNEELLQRWLTDHPGETEIPKSVKVGLQNVKGILRSKRRRRQRNASAAGAIAAVTERTKLSGPRQSQLETLEDRIDDVLMFARSLDEDALQDVIGLLRRARNEVVWKMGQ
jgi:hypothetical protein